MHFYSFDDLILSEQIKNVISNGTCSGSTAVCAFIDERNDDERIITIANLGNSKAILIDDDGIRFITKDHNPHDSIEKARIESAGHVVLDGKVDGRLNISRVFGRMDLKREDIEKAKTMAIERTPDVTRIPMLDKDRFLVLASDSVIKALDCARVDITTIINEQLRKNSYCLLDTVIAILNFCQSRNLDRCENMTLILISLKKLDKQFNEEDIQENEDFNERIKINTLALLDEKEIQTYGRDATIPIYHRLLKKFQDDIEKLEDFNIEDFKKKDFNERIKINTLALLYGSEIQKFCLGKTFPYLVSNKLSRNATFSDFEVRIERIVLAFLNEYKTRECDPSSIIPIRDILLKKLRSDIKNLCYKLTFIDRIVKNYFKQF